MKVVLQNLTKIFPSRDKKVGKEVVAVNDFTFEIPDGKLIGLLIATPTHGVIHDFLAQTVTVDLPSQLIFNTEEALLEYKKKVAAEDAARKPY